MKKHHGEVTVGKSNLGGALFELHWSQDKNSDSQPNESTSLQNHTKQ
jgi:hypothetical protein